MRSLPFSVFISRYHFELILILIELIVCAIVALTLLKLLAPAAGLVLAAEPQPTSQRPFKRVTLTPLPTPAALFEPVGITIAITELPTSLEILEPTPVTLVERRWPGSTSPIKNYTPLSFWPVQGAISQDFGCSPFFTGIPGQGCPAAQPWFHDGLDLTTWPGAPVRAGLTGTVSFAGPDGDGPPCGDFRGYGLGVIIDNGSSWQSLYAHLSEIKVVTGQQVTPDTVIGTVGDTGCVTGAHLHFGLRRNGALVNPEQYLPQ
ncbi:MAG: M23 family metallopeptidase [Anaerolineae bacterium]|nr:M23 family metallopeptidase [Anaerolineae bacterium]